jgi:hypothetical protein
VAATSCGGGTLSEKSLQTQAEAIQSLAAEGMLVATGVAEARTTDVFTRVHSDYLQKEARKVETKLASESASGTLDKKRATASRLAGRVADELEELHRAPGDRALAGHLRSLLEHDADQAKRLAK